MEELNVLKCGQIIGTHGVKGQLRLLINNNLEVKKGTWCFLIIQEKPVPFFIDDVSAQGGDVVVVKLNGIDNLDLASNFRAHEVAFEEEYFNLYAEKNQQSVLDDYIGLVLKATNGDLIGEVIDLFNNGGQILLEVKANSEKLLIPFHENWVKEYDEKKGLLILDLPDGLLDL